MSKTKINNNEIINGFKFFKSSENSNKIQPKDLKNLMDKLGLKNKIFFTYNIVDSLCSNKEIKRNGGITKAEFTPYLEKKMDELYNEEGIHALTSLLKSPNNNSNKKYKSCNKDEKQNEIKYEELIKKELNLNINDFSKYIKLNDKNFKRDSNTLKKYEKKQKNKTNEKYKYNFRNRFPLNNTGIKNVDKKDNEYKLKNNKEEI